MFVDKVKIVFQAGDGGDGITSFRHEKFRARGGPEGGDGGDGGDIILEASRNQNTLANFRYKKTISAESGKNGQRRKKHGKSGNDLHIKIPAGTVLNSVDGQIIEDMTDDGQTYVIAKGGKGGFGNAHFVSSTRQAPQVAEQGEKGQQIEVVLELKMIADVGLIGLPNAGKSTLLSVISNAKPEIADYPFTTLKPNLGVVDINENLSLLFADIPGLIEGASRGKGLGDEFLRHIERTNILVHLIDVYNDDINSAYKTVIKELDLYQPGLSKRPQIIALTKIDGFDTKKLSRIKKTMQSNTGKSTSVIAISARSGQGVDELLQAVQKALAKHTKSRGTETKSKKIPVIGLKRDYDDWSVQQRGQVFIVTGKKIERFAARTKFGDFYGEQRLKDIMIKMGIMQELEKRGIEPDQEIHIGSPGIGEIKY